MPKSPRRLDGSHRAVSELAFEALVIHDRELNNGTVFLTVITGPEDQDYLTGPDSFLSEEEAREIRQRTVYVAPVRQWVSKLSFMAPHVMVERPGWLDFDKSWKDDYLVHVVLHLLMREVAVVLAPPRLRWLRSPLQTVEAMSMKSGSDEDHLDLLSFLCINSKEASYEAMHIRSGKI